MKVYRYINFNKSLEQRAYELGQRGDAQEAMAYLEGINKYRQEKANDLVNREKISADQVPANISPSYYRGQMSVGAYTDPYEGSPLYDHAKSGYPFVDTRVGRHLDDLKREGYKSRRQAKFLPSREEMERRFREKKQRGYKDILLARRAMKKRATNDIDRDISTATGIDRILNSEATKQNLALLEARRNKILEGIPPIQTPPSLPSMAFK